MKDDLNRLSQDLEYKFQIKNDFVMKNYQELSKPNQGLAGLCNFHLSKTSQ